MNGPARQPRRAAPSEDSLRRMLEQREQEKETERLRLSRILSRILLVFFAVIVLSVVGFLKIGGYLDGPGEALPATQLPADSNAKPGDTPAKRMAEKLDVPFGSELLDFLK